MYKMKCQTNNICFTQPRKCTPLLLLMVYVSRCGYANAFSHFQSYVNKLSQFLLTYKVCRQKENRYKAIEKAQINAACCGNEEDVVFPSLSVFFSSFPVAAREWAVARLRQISCNDDFNVVFSQARSHSPQGLAAQQTRAHPLCPADGHAAPALQQIHGGAHLRSVCYDSVKWSVLLISKLYLYRFEFLIENIFTKGPRHLI